MSSISEAARDSRPTRIETALKDAVRVAGPPLLIGIRLWASVSLALYVAFWLKLDNAQWAGTSAAIVCQPQLGASLRKGWFRMIGTMVGATMIVVLTACFPQDRVPFLGLLALWCGICAFAATVFRNFASYAAALAGYTAVIIGADTLGATGGMTTEVFMLAITRASEICIGIVCAGIVLAGTDLGGAQRQLAATFATLTTEIMERFTRMLTLAEPQQPDTQPQRREFVRRVIALGPVVDQAIGESSQLRYRSPILQMAVHGLFNALDGWRGVAAHLKQLPEDKARQNAEIILRNLPLEVRPASESDVPTRWMADLITLRRIYEGAVRALLVLPAGTPSLRLMADQTAKLLSGILRALDGLALLIEAPGRPLPSSRGVWLTVPDWLPALVNAGRACITIGAIELFWVTTTWPNGATAITFAAISVLLSSPRADQAYATAMGFTLVIAVAVPLVAIIAFALLPGLETFTAFSAVIGLYLIPVGTLMARSRQPGMFLIMSANFIPLLAPANQMSYNTVQFYNAALAIVAGGGAAALSFRLLPPLSPALRTRRLLFLTLRDVRRLAIGPVPPRADDWERRSYGRLAALPDQAEPLQRAQLLAAHFVGGEVIQLRHIDQLVALGPEFEDALVAAAQGRSAVAITQLAQLDDRLTSRAGAEPEASLLLRARASILALSEVLDQHTAYFDAGAVA